MANTWIEFQMICPKCGGDGKIVEPHNTQNPPPAEVECVQCSGEGYTEFGRIKITEIINAIDSVGI